MEDSCHLPPETQINYRFTNRGIGKPFVKLLLKFCKVVIVSCNAKHCNCIYLLVLCGVLFETGTRSSNLGSWIQLIVFNYF